MNHMESSSLRDVKASNEDNKKAGTDGAANNMKIVAAENITSKSVESPVSVSCHDESNLLEDVKVCDTCGDPGREDLLATCSKCSDGAEHIYCMHIRLEKVPDNGWICEDCVLSEFKNKQTQTRFSNSATTPKYNKNKLDQEVEASGASNVKLNPVPDSKGLDIDKNRIDKLSCQPSVKKSLSNAQSALLMRRKALGLDKLLTSRQYSKAPKSQDFSEKSNHESSLPKNLSGTMENADMSTVTGQNFPKSHQLPTSSGLLTKSKSFNGSDRRPKVQFLENNPAKHKICTKRKSCAFRSLKKSLSFSEGSAGHPNALDVVAKTGTPELPDVSYLKRLRPMKECSSADIEVKPILKKPRILPPGGFSSASSGDKKFASHSEPMSAQFSGTKCSNSKTAKTSIESGTASADEEKPFTKSNNPTQELRNKGEVTSSSLLASRRHLSSDATGQAKLPSLQRLSHQSLKAPQSSDSRMNDGCTSDGTGSVMCHESETVAHATNCHAEDSSSISAIDMGREKDLNKSCGRNLAPPLCYHFNVNGSLAVPLFDYIWKGEFEVHSISKLPGVLCGIQAHLSTQSSPKIPEVVKKFPDKILLEEVPRLTTWPIQFLQYQPRDDSIGLYFFAQDIESYSRYKSFLQCMIDYDLALKGNLDGIELLIFSSNLLPEKSRCWNKLLFLWGIFKQRKFVAT